jgi:nucleoside-diphosphate-sugar epimerase
MALDQLRMRFQDRLGGKRVLVTGGAGFIGSNLCHTLAEAGAHVVAIDNFLQGGGANEANLRGASVELLRGDLRDVNLHALTEGVDFVFNMAACTGHIASQEEPELDLSINAGAQLPLIRAVRTAAPQAVVVHASTRQLYGKPIALPVDESHPVVPPDANSVSKLAGEQYWMLEHRTKGRAVISLRMTNCYGPRLRINDGKQGFLGHWFRAALLGQPFEVWGGNQLRDLTYVDDVCCALITAALEPRCYGRVFNVGGSAPVSLRELAELFVKVSGGRASYLLKEFPQAQLRIDIGSYYTDDSAFRSASGFAPAVGLEDGLQRTLAWYRTRLSSYLNLEQLDGH